MNWDQPENRELITKSFDHWMSIPAAFRGYSWTGAASICAAIDRPDDAVKYLQRLRQRRRADTRACRTRTTRRPAR